MRQWTSRVKECVKLLKNENWKNKIFNLHFPICNFKYYNSSWRHRRHASMDAIASMDVSRQWTPRLCL